MKSVKLPAFIMVLSFLVLAAGCGGGGGGSPAPTLVSITVTPANSTLAVGTSVPFTAVGTYSDNSTQNLTSSAAWTSSAGGVATVSDAAGSKGTVTAVTDGTATITATVGNVSGSTNLTLTADGAAPANVMAITVNGSLCTASSYLNKPCVSVTVCNPDQTVCQTVNDILLDTGSYGLRIFQQAIPTLTLPQVASGPGSLTGCVQFADGSSLWGPIKRAAVKLGNEPAVQIPIQVIDASFGTLPLPCADADPSPVSSGFTGILGVGVLAEDCGPGCVFSSANGIYYRCSGADCIGTTVALADQVQNPVAHLPLDNNGLLVQLPSVPTLAQSSPPGATSIDGSLILGIGTRANNTPASPIVFPTDQNGDIRTVFNGLNTVGFFDTGSNGLFFPNVDPAVLPVCAPPNTDWYCPPVTRSLLATNVGALGTPSSNVSFNVSNFLTLVSSPNNVFSDIGGPSNFGFDWGLPFFMGRNVLFGIEGKATSLGTGPYVAY